MGQSKADGGMQREVHQNAYLGKFRKRLIDGNDYRDVDNNIDPELGNQIANKYMDIRMKRLLMVNEPIEPTKPPIPHPKDNKFSLSTRNKYEEPEFQRPTKWNPVNWFRPSAWDYTDRTHFEKVTYNNQQKYIQDVKNYDRDRLIYKEAIYLFVTKNFVPGPPVVTTSTPVAPGKKKDVFVDEEIMQEKELTTPFKSDKNPLGDPAFSLSSAYYHVDPFTSKPIKTMFVNSEKVVRNYCIEKRSNKDIMVVSLDGRLMTEFDYYEGDMTWNNGRTGKAEYRM